MEIVSSSTVVNDYRIIIIIGRKIIFMFNDKIDQTIVLTLMRELIGPRFDASCLRFKINRGKVVSD